MVLLSQGAAGPETDTTSHDSVSSVSTAVQCSLQKGEAWGTESGNCTLWMPIALVALMLPWMANRFWEANSGANANVLLTFIAEGSGPAWLSQIWGCRQLGADPSEKGMNLPTFRICVSFSCVPGIGRDQRKKNCLGRAGTRVSPALRRHLGTCLEFPARTLLHLPAWHWAGMGRVEPWG